MHLVVWHFPQVTQLGRKFIETLKRHPEDEEEFKIKFTMYGYLSQYLPIQILSLDPQGSVSAGEPDPWVQVFAGIPTGIPTGNLYGPAPMSSLKSNVLIH